MLLQHYHSSTNLSRKLEVSLRYLQLQLGTPHNPFTLDYDNWGHLAPLSWVKMMWRSLHHFDIHIYMEYPSIPSPRERDQVVMELIVGKVLDRKMIKSLSRCRGALEIIFLSDMTTADGRYLEQFVFDPGSKIARSKYKFPRECPTKKDWEVWFNFWHDYTATGDKLHIPLGAWIAPTHRTWIWYYNSSTDDLHRVEKGKVYHYLRTENYRITRSSTLYNLAWEKDLTTNFKRGAPTSVLTYTTTKVIRLKEGSSFAQDPETPTNFWKFLDSWGGTWMWENIDDSQQSKHNLLWLAEGMKSNTLTWVTDGSYDRKQAADLCGVGWIIFCSKTGIRLTGTFWERSQSASSYRAEMLGLCSLHLLARALSEFYQIQDWDATLCCDNKSALEQSAYTRKRIRPSAKCADIQRSLKSTKHTFKGKFTYLHVYGHMDKYLLWHQLSLIQQLNCVCDTLAKQAVKIALTQGCHDRPTQLLPKEDVAVVIWGNKITDDVSSSIRFHASKEEARRYLGTRKKKPWSNEQFDEVDWEHLELALKTKPDMYKIWRSKQNSGFCGTRVQVGRYSGVPGQDKRCPNCGRQETAAHLLICPSKDRTRLLIENTDELEKWLAKDDSTDQELAYWIPKYIQMRGDKPFTDLGAMSPKMKALAQSQDVIGYREFMEGHISVHFYEIQNFHLSMSSNILNGTDWTKQFISKILHITHSQWIFRNFSLHDKRYGYLHKKKAEEITVELEMLAGLAPEDVPAESRFLLEINFNDLNKSNVEVQQYWILAIQAALNAQRRQLARGARAKRIKDKVNKKLPSRTKLGIVAVEQQIRSDQRHFLHRQEEHTRFQEHNQSSISGYLAKKRPHPATFGSVFKSNKRLRKPD
jgi:hypothetical protein